MRVRCVPNLASVGSRDGDVIVRTYKGGDPLDQALSLYKSPNERTMSTEAQSQYQQQQQQQPADGASRPDMPHRSSSTQHVAQDDAHTHAGADTYASKDDGADIKPASRQPTVARPSHRGVGHDESKPYKHDPEHEQQTHDGAVPEKITTSGPPQPDPERAEKERAERREAQKAAKDKGAGDQNYPEQIHAGKAGVGPHIADRDRAVSGLRFSCVLCEMADVVRCRRSPIRSRGSRRW